MNLLTEKFLGEIEVIRALKPQYKLGCSGYNGYCDCIGLDIGALSRMGIKWDGIHGTNWAARKEMTQKVIRIPAVSVLQLGDLVYKARAPGEAKYDLPARYRKGGKYYDGDLNDYYHVGTVTGVNPLRITHMTSPTVKVDTSLGKWAWFGKLKKLGDGGIVPVPDPEPVPVPVPPDPAPGVQAVVTAPSGQYVKMRKEPYVTCRLWENVPVGAVVTIEKPGEVWAQISYGSRHGWYMMAKYLEII